MLANRAEFARHTPTGPQEFDTVVGSAFGANTFRRFLAQADRLNAFYPFVGIAGPLLCFHGCFSILGFGLERISVLESDRQTAIKGA